MPVMFSLRRQSNLRQLCSVSIAVAISQPIQEKSPDGFFVLVLPPKRCHAVMTLIIGPVSYRLLHFLIKQALYAIFFHSDHTFVTRCFISPYHPPALSTGQILPSPCLTDSVYALDPRPVSGAQTPLLRMPSSLLSLTEGASSMHGRWCDTEQGRVGGAGSGRVRGVLCLGEGEKDVCLQLK